MTEDDLHAMVPQLEAFHGRFGPFFRGPHVQALSRHYLNGLTMPIERKNVENISEQVGAHRRALQLFISESPWDDQGCITELQRFVGEQLGQADGVLVLDDTGFAKKGTCSAGVGRQYSGTLGRVDNCQVGSFLAYASAQGHTLVDRELYIPEAWFEKGSADRRKRAGIPAGTSFQTKIQLAMLMLNRVHISGNLPHQWVTGDAAFGDAHDLRAWVDEHNKLYCFEVSSNAEVWTTDPAWVVPPPSGRGRPARKGQPTPSSPQAQTVAEVGAGLPPSAWIRHRVTEGTKGPREYEFTRLRVVEKRHGRPGTAAWMMGRRAVGGDIADAKYYLSNAPDTMDLAEMARVGCLRWTIEENFEMSKGEVGLDHYEVTKYRGWYHHITMSLLALAFLKSVQRELGKKIRRSKRSGVARHARGRSAQGSMGSSADHRLATRSTPPQGSITTISPASLASRTSRR